MASQAILERLRGDPSGLSGTDLCILLTSSKSDPGVEPIVSSYVEVHLMRRILGSPLGEPALEMYRRMITRYERTGNGGAFFDIEGGAWPGNLNMVRFQVGAPIQWLGAGAWTPFAGDFMGFGNGQGRFRSY